MKITELIEIISRDIPEYKINLSSLPDPFPDNEDDIILTVYSKCFNTPKTIIICGKSKRVIGAQG